MVLSQYRSETWAHDPRLVDVDERWLPVERRLLLLLCPWVLSVTFRLRVGYGRFFFPIKRATIIHYVSTPSTPEN